MEKGGRRLRKDRRDEEEGEGEEKRERSERERKRKNDEREKSGTRGKMRYESKRRPRGGKGGRKGDEQIKRYFFLSSCEFVKESKNDFLSSRRSCAIRLR